MDEAANVDAVVIGIGQLGLCFALTLEKSGLSVIGVDTRADYVAQINKRTLLSKEPGVTERLQSAKRFEATTDMVAAGARSNLLFILVPTPTSGNAERFYDHSMVSNVLEALNRERLADKSVVINATVSARAIYHAPRAPCPRCLTMSLDGVGAIGDALVATAI